MCLIPTPSAPGELTIKQLTIYELDNAHLANSQLTLWRTGQLLTHYWSTHYWQSRQLQTHTQPISHSDQLTMVHFRLWQSHYRSKSLLFKLTNHEVNLLRSLEKWTLTSLPSNHVSIVRKPTCLKYLSEIWKLPWIIKVYKISVYNPFIRYWMFQIPTFSELGRGQRICGFIISCIGWPCFNSDLHAITIFHLESG